MQLPGPPFEAPFLVTLSPEPGEDEHGPLFRVLLLQVLEPLMAEKSWFYGPDPWHQPSPLISSMVVPGAGRHHVVVGVG
ncbi:MAG: hypothetical protein HPY65_00740 [Syntrophaceae bacterium]|nr:hypothetical protein [Syntrophaceae bacterium]